MLFSMHYFVSLIDRTYELSISPTACDGRQVQNVKKKIISHLSIYC